MDWAERVAEMSHAVRLKVGCVIVKDSNILSYSWNGTLPNRPNECEDILSDGTLVTKDEVLHSEENAILKAAKYGVSLQDATLFVTHLPCIKCCRMIVASGIKNVYYKHNYKSINSLQLLGECGINIQRID